ncbi:MAG TPA: Rieske (2Fe-2S) protein [Actinobacteria bacterium]|nr:Rieske (2Fe-2S) protein [Actinomycetota bacterium]
METKDLAGFEAVCSLADLVPDVPHVVQVRGHEIAVIRTCGSIFAILNECSHADVVLDQGEVSDCHIECWLHGSRFNLRTGEPDSLPAIRSVPVYGVRLSTDGADAEVLVNPDADPHRSGFPIDPLEANQ